MADPVITNIDLGSYRHSYNKEQPDTLTLAGADTIAKGTILARDSVSGKLVLFVKGGATNENGIPKAILAEEITVTGAGDSSVRVTISGNVKKPYLIIDADGDDSNIDAVVKDQLSDYGITVLEVTEHGILDNQ